MPPRADRVHPHQALAVYAESLVAGRRVVVLGDGVTGLTDRLEELGATSVVLVGPGDGLDDVRAARFDLAIVDDLARFENQAEVMARVRRMVGESGVALVAASNREAEDAADGPSLDYYALFDLVAREFEDVRMVAELPFHGVALAEVGDEDESPAVSVDTQLADPDRAPRAFIAVASQRGTSLDPYAIVALPAGEEDPGDDAELGAVRLELEDTRAALDVSRGQLDDARRQMHAVSTRLDALEGPAARSADLERELSERGRQLAELSTDVEGMRSAAEAGSVATSQVEALALRADRAERALAALEPEALKAAERQDEELVRFEEALRERAHAVRSLEAEVARRERLVRDLVATIEELSAADPAHAVSHGAASNGAPEPALVAALTDDNARLQQKLDALAVDLARREAESQATAWKVQELERMLAAAPSRPGATAQGDVLDQLDALRRALTQEHEARLRAESGEELARARAEIQRQSALLSQLGQPPAEPEELR